MFALCRMVNMDGVNLSIEYSMKYFEKKEFVKFVLDDYIYNNIVLYLINVWQTSSFLR